MTNGTDTPVEDVNPIPSFYGMVSRVAKDGKVRKKLYDNGRAAMTLFLDGNGTPEHPPWDFDEYKRMMRS